MSVFPEAFEVADLSVYWPRSSTIWIVPVIWYTPDEVDNVYVQSSCLPALFDHCKVTVVVRSFSPSLSVSSASFSAGNFSFNVSDIVFKLLAVFSEYRVVATVAHGQCVKQYVPPMCGAVGDFRFQVPSMLLCSGLSPFVVHQFHHAVC